MKIVHCLAPILETVDVFFFIFRVASVLDVADAFQVVTGGSGCDDFTTDLSGLVSVKGRGLGYEEFGV